MLLIFKIIYFFFLHKISLAQVSMEFVSLRQQQKLKYFKIVVLFPKVSTEIDKR
jgi:hypothetical protein